MSQTPPLADAATQNGRDRTPELTSKREKRHREDDEEDNRDRSGRSHRHRREHDDDERDRERERERRHRRHRENETEEERRERHRRRDEETEEERRERHRRRDEETEEEREERRRKRREREREREREPRSDRERERERDRDQDREREREHDDLRRGSRDRSADPRARRDRSRESHRSHRSRDVEPRVSAIKEMTREEKEAEREKRDREMADEKREAARAREERFAEMDRQRELERRQMRDYSPPRRRRPSPNYDQPPHRERERERERDRDPATTLLEEVDSESRSILVTQLSVKLTSADLGLFFEDKLGRGAVRDARVVTDKVSRRSKGIGYVELDAVELVNRALSLSGTIVMGLPINIMLTEAERNRQGQAAALAAIPTGGATSGSIRPPITFGTSFPPLSTGLALPAGIEPDAHGADAAIPFHRLFISNLATTLGGDDFRQVFEPFGDIEFVDLHVDFSGQRKGTAYVQFKELRAAQMALDAMNGFDLAGRIIRVQSIQERAYQATEQIEETGNYGTRLDNNQRQQLMFKLARTEPTVNLALSAHKPVVQSKSPSMNPSPFVAVSNMFNPEEETERNWDLDLAEDVKGEVEGKYGRVKRIKVEKMSAGEVYLEFAEIDGATKAIKGLNGRFFGGRQLQATYISETLFKAHL